MTALSVIIAALLWAPIVTTAVPAVVTAAVADEALASEPAGSALVAEDASPAPTAQPRLELLLPEGPVPIGWFDLVVRGEFSEDADLRLDPVPDDVLVGSARFVRRLGPDELRLPVASWRAGELVFEGLSFVDGDVVTALDSATVLVAEQSPKGTVARVSELLQPLALPLPPADLTVFAAVLLAALILLWIWVVRSSRIVITPVYVPPVDHVALQALDRLRLKLPRTSEEVLVFIVAVSDVLRSYIEGRFSVHAPARTTEEFLLEASAADEGLAQRAEGLESFLTQCDLVKYARHRPGPEEAKAMLDGAGQFVEETR